MIPLGIALDTAIAFLKRYKALIAIIPLCLALAWQTYQVSRWKGKEADARATIAQMQVASEQARAKQIALNNANQELSQRIAANEVAKNAQIVAATNDAIADYARRNRLRQDGKGCTIRPDLAALPNNPGGLPEGGEVADMVAIPRDEFETLARKAVQDDRKTSFLIELVNNGLAVPLEYPEPELSARQP